MAVVVTFSDTSFPLTVQAYKVTGLVNGANTITLPTPPLKGSFPPAADWTPSFVFAFPYNTGAVGAVVSLDPTTITNTVGVVVFTLYCSNATNAYILVA